jgi:hypothetical protein
LVLDFWNLLIRIIQIMSMFREWLYHDNS